MIRKILLSLFITAVICCSCEGQNGEKRRTRTNIDMSVKVVDTISKGINSFVDKKTNFNVYIENSASMDGYVQGTADFKTTIYTYLQYINIGKLCDSLNLFYLNSRVFPQLTVTKNNTETLKVFIDKLNPDSFRNDGTIPGKKSRGSSDIDDLMRSIVKTTDNDVVSILITDGIFSPGGKDASEFIAAQKVGLMGTFSTLMEKLDNAAVILYKMESQFNGIYYDKNDEDTLYKGNRPYYIWVLGSADNLSTLVQEVPVNKFYREPKNIYMISEVTEHIPYTVDHSCGSHDTRKSNNTEIVNLKKDRAGNVTFAINVDFSKILVSDNYLLNSDNYSYNMDEYNLEVYKISGNPKYTHKLKFTSEDGRPHLGELSIKLKMDSPQWADESNEDKGEEPVDGKTYGLKYQMEGLYEAFTKDNKDEHAFYNDMRIKIK